MIYLAQAVGPKACSFWRNSGAMVNSKRQPKTNASAIGDTCDKAVLPSKSNASESVSRAAIGDTGNNDNPLNTSVNGTATPSMEYGVATTPDMPQAWSDTSMVGDPEEYAKNVVLGPLVLC